MLEFMQSFAALDLPDCSHQLVQTGGEASALGLPARCVEGVFALADLDRAHGGEWSKCILDRAPSSSLSTEICRCDSFYCSQVCCARDRSLRVSNRSQRDSLCEPVDVLLYVQVPAGISR